MLFNGASCQSCDDWKLEQRRSLRDLAAKQQKQDEERQQQACYDTAVLCCAVLCWMHASQKYELANMSVWRARL